MAFKDDEERRAWYREYNKGWYQRHREKRIQLMNRRRMDLMEWFREYKSKLCCVECGESHPACLHFHHKDRTEKRFTISQIVGRSTCSKVTLMREIEKCEVLCGNCHALRHWREEHGDDDWLDTLSQSDR